MSKSIISIILLYHESFSVCAQTPKLYFYTETQICISFPIDPRSMDSRQKNMLSSIWFTVSYPNLCQQDTDWQSSRSYPHRSSSPNYQSIKYIGVRLRSFSIIPKTKKPKHRFYQHMKLVFTGRNRYFILFWDRARDGSSNMMDGNRYCWNRYLMIFE